MLKLSDIRDWLKGFDCAEHYYIGKLDGRFEKSVGVYQRGGSYAPVRAVGHGTYEIKRITLLLHRNRNADETEEAAYRLYQELSSLRGNFMVGGTLVYYITLVSSEPVDVGTDDGGVYERTIDIDFYYQKEEETE